jgi:hypothetical protein
MNSNPPWRAILKSTMSTNSPTTEGDPSARDDSSAVFGRTMSGIRAHCKQLAASIQSCDTASVERIASDAASMWLRGRAACRRLIERCAASSPFAQAARRLLEDNYMTLLELFECATRTIHVPGTRNVLRGLRGLLMTAMARPLVVTADTKANSRPEERQRSDS